MAAPKSSVYSKSRCCGSSRSTKDCATPSTESRNALGRSRSRTSSTRGAPARNPRDSVTRPWCRASASGRDRPGAGPLRVAFQAPGDDPLGINADQLAAVALGRRLGVRQCLGPTADLDAAHPPWADRNEVVDDERRPAGRLYVAGLPGRTHSEPTDVERFERVVPEEADWIV